MGWLFISGVGWNVASMWEVNAHPTDNDLFGKSQSIEADLKRSSLYRRDCKPRWLRTKQTKCWFGRVKGPPNSTQATLVVLTHAISLVLEHSFRGKGLGCLWIQFKLANYVIAQTPERKIQWSNMFRSACKATATAKWIQLWVLLHDLRRNVVPIFIQAIFNIRSYQWRQIKRLSTSYSSLL